MFNRSELPSALTSLIADQGVIDNQGSVQTWTDQSGSGNDAVGFSIVNGASQPVILPNGLGGKQVLDFNGAVMSFTLPASEEYSFFFVIAPRTLKQAYEIFCGSSDAPGARWAFGCGGDSGEGLGWGSNDLGNSNFIPVSTFKLVSFIKSDYKWSIYCNGDLIREVSDSSYPNYSGLHTWCLGRELTNAPDYYFDGKIAEILILEDAVKQGQRKKIEKQIMEYWSI